MPRQQNRLDHPTVDDQRSRLSPTETARLTLCDHHESCARTDPSTNHAGVRGSAFGGGAWDARRGVLGAGPGSGAARARRRGRGGRTSRRRGIEPGDEGTTDPLEFLVVVDALEPAAAPGLGQLLAEQGQGRCREGAHAAQAVHDVVGRCGVLGHGLQQGVQDGRCLGLAGDLSERGRAMHPDPFVVVRQEASQARQCDGGRRP